MIEPFTATASSTGTVTIQFVTVKDNAQVNGIEIAPSGSTGNTVTVTGPGNQTGTVGTAASLQIRASDSASGQTLTYTATGLPAGLSISSATGLITGTPTTAGTSNVTVTATDTTGASRLRHLHLDRHRQHRPRLHRPVEHSRTSVRTSTSSTRACPPPPSRPR